MTEAASPSPRLQFVGWGLLGGLLILLLFGVLAADREDWPSFIGDEATYLMAAESLAWDFDLLYHRKDYDRFVEHWGIAPEGLILQSGDHGRSMTFSKPFFYPAYLAPFVRLAPRKGALVANVLLLALAAWLAAKTLRRWVGGSAPLLVAVFIFASATFIYAYWAHADLFLLSLCAISLALVFSDPEGHPGRRSLIMWALGGVLLAAVAFSRPFYVPLLIPAAFCAPRPRLPRLAAFWGGAVLLVLASLMIHQGLGDSWTSYDGERAAFYSRTGFAEVDFAGTEWDAFIHKWGNFAWNPAAIAEGKSFSPRLWLWNGIYFGIGRHLGVLIYFLPLVLGLVAGPKDHPRWALAAAIVAAVAGAFLLRPFNFFGGGASIANRYFLPIYPAFWFLAGGPIRSRWLLGVTAASAIFVFPLWTDPGGYPVRADRSYRYVSPVASSLLPFEKSQSHLKPSGQEDLLLDGVWIRLLGPQVRSHEGSYLTLERDRRGRLLLGSPEPIEELDLIVISPIEVELETRGARVKKKDRRGDQVHFRLELDRADARHPMWWSAKPMNLYVLDIEFDAPPGLPGLPVPFIVSRRPAQTGADPELT